MTLKHDSSLTEKAVAAMRAAVKGVVEDHRRQGRPLVVWRDGKVVKEMPAAEPSVREPKASYGADAQEEHHED
ncbi:MAG: hypothetical protein HYU64_08860 [Armatimonadetes bacterium]|nr:hypothetical protein [Armatimonadota bacterium]